MLGGRTLDSCHASTRDRDVSEERGEQSIHHALKDRETMCRAIFNLHARPAFSSSSKTERANMLLTQNRTW